MPSTAWTLAQPGVIRQVEWGGSVIPLAECALCGRERPIKARGLCGNCYKRCDDDGTLREFGWTKAEKIKLYARTRASYKPDGTHPTIPQAAKTAGVTARTGQRYEDELAAAGRAPWRASDLNVLAASRRDHRRHRTGGQRAARRWAYRDGA